MIPIVEWAESDQGFYLAETKRPIRLADHQKAILDHCFTLNRSGKLPYETVLISCPKKSGKTTLASLVATWAALFLDPPNEIFLCANDLEQVQGRVFKDVTQGVRLNPVLSQRVHRKAKEIVFDNGTTVTAIPSDYTGAAGSRHGLTVWDELWGYTSENSQRLWDELTPIPTKTNSIRLIVSYAGYEGESQLLEKLYNEGMKGTPVRTLKHIKNGRGKPACRANGKLFVYWDHELKPHDGLVVSPKEYHEQQRIQLRPSAFARLHLNEWVSSISAFVSREHWDACYSDEVKTLVPGDGRRVVFGLDASTSRDTTALIGVWRDPVTLVCHVVYVKIWEPRKSELRPGKKTVDLSQTVGKEILRLAEMNSVHAVLFDPYQLHSLSLDLKRAGVNMREFPQTSQRVASDQGLYDGIVNRTLLHGGHPTLTEHIGHAVAVETSRGWRLAKEKTSRPIDGAVALAMAYHGATEMAIPQPLPAVNEQIVAPSRWDMDADRDRHRGSRWDRLEARHPRPWEPPRRF